jgi:two-component system chemotaxis response regulator CheY
MTYEPVITKSAPGTMKAGREMPVLVVDETPTALAVRTHLRQLGFVSVDVVGTGQGALDRLANARYGLVLSEWTLFDTDAALLLRAIRQVERHRRMPFIVVTANRNPKDVFAARNAGVDRYILKPYSLAILRAQLETVFGPMPWSTGAF